MAGVVISGALISKTRQSWFENIVKCNYVMNGTTYKGTIQNKEIVGNAVRFHIGITKRVDGTGSDSISKVILMDRAGQQVAEVDGPFTKKQLQGRYFRLDLILKEG